MRVLAELAVVALVVWGVHLWRRPAPEPASETHSGLSAPPAEALRPNKPQKSMLVVAESRAGSRALGSTPALLDPHGGSPAAPLDAPERDDAPWYERLRDPRALGGVFAAFLVLWGLLARLLRRGGTGRGLTHD
jgi:hypothetical protein